MGLLKPYIDRLEKASNDMERVAIQAVRENEEFVLDLLKNEQLGKGLDSFGKDILHPNGNANGTYMPNTQNYWAKKPPKPRTPKITGKKFNMDWTGRFKDTMKVKYDDKGYTVDSATKRAMEAIYGVNLTKLTKEHSEIIDKKIIEPALYKHIFNVAFA